jgi:deoxyadenosine/deoxycytidine kinase
MGNKFTIELNGGISSGKTTLGTVLSNTKVLDLITKRHFPEVVRETDLSVHFYPETGHEGMILEAWLKHPKELAAVFQMHMHSMCIARQIDVESKLRVESDVACIIDRCPTGNAIFAITSTIEPFKRISKKEIEFYRTAYRKHTTSEFSHSDYSIYLWTRPQTCIDRCAIRDNKAEKDSYDVSYFKQLESIAFVAILAKLSKVENENFFIVLDWNADYSNVDERERSDLASSAFERVADGYFSALKRGEGQSNNNPCDVVLSKSTCIDHSSFDAVFDFSGCKTESEVFSYENVESVYDVISYAGEFNKFKRVFIQFPEFLSKSPFYSPFELSFQ